MATSIKPQKNIGYTSSLMHVLKEGVFIILVALAVYLFLALVTYSSQDPGWSHGAHNPQIVNIGGIAGAWFSDLIFYLFGYLAYVTPFMVVLLAWVFFSSRKSAPQIASIPAYLAFKISGFLLTVGAGSSLAQLHFHQTHSSLPLNSGGILGQVIGIQLVDIFNFTGTTLFLLALFLFGVTLLTGISWSRLIDITGLLTLKSGGVLKSLLVSIVDKLKSRRIPNVLDKAPLQSYKQKRSKPRLEPALEKVEFTQRIYKEKSTPLFKRQISQGGLPPLSLLDEPTVAKSRMSSEALDAISRRVEIILKDFGVDVVVVAVQPGPVVTRFELLPAPGIKVNQITNLAKDLARTLSVISVRVVEVIAGKSVVGLEIPNEHREVVHLSETLQSKEYDAAESPVTLALGKDIAGHPTVVDLAKMPHLLVAGTTGSGKSVALNAMILSILYKALPSQVRMIMVDPKMLELSVYDSIPHLLTPVVTDMKQAANALRWCVVEMETRYRVMSHLGVRNIAGYNRKIEEAIKAGSPLLDPFYKPKENQPTRPLEAMPLIVVVIDELADMMMVVGKKVEELIARLAQKARAAGIHLLLATQRPSVDVLTGLIKANIPTRIAFQVSSKIDSRTILDQMGAEQLLGHGDMLYLPPGRGVPVRVHGAFVADHEVHKVVSYLKGTGSPNYLDEILNPDMGEGGGFLSGYSGDDAEADELYDQAVEFVTQSRKASISSVQRRLKVGYNRAARMVEAMEAAGVVGPVQSNGMREVLAPPPLEN